jgi:hypothetical protein
MTSATRVSAAWALAKAKLAKTSTESKANTKLR